MPPHFVCATAIPGDAVLSSAVPFHSSRGARSCQPVSDYDNHSELTA